MRREANIGYVNMRGGKTHLLGEVGGGERPLYLISSVKTIY